MKSLPPRRPRRAFTLTEVLVALGLLGLVGASLTAFFIFNLNAYYMTIGRLMVNRDIRDFTANMTSDARNADTFDLFTSYADRTRMTEGMSGDFLVLGFYEDVETPAGSGTFVRTLTRTVGFYRDAGGGAVGPVRRFELRRTALIDPAVLPTTVLPGHEVVWQLARGLSNQRLFHNFRNRSIMVRAEIVHPGRIGRRATNTYNFTVSPRS